MLPSTNYSHFHAIEDNIRLSITHIEIAREQVLRHPEECLRAILALEELDRILAHLRNLEI
jgi:hypothetical protein